MGKKGKRISDFEDLLKGISSGGKKKFPRRKKFFQRLKIIISRIFREVGDRVKGTMSQIFLIFIQFILIFDWFYWNIFFFEKFLWAKNFFFNFFSLFLGEILKNILVWFFSFDVTLKFNKTRENLVVWGTYDLKTWNRPLSSFYFSPPFFSKWVFQWLNFMLKTF